MNTKRAEAIRLCLRDPQHSIPRKIFSKGTLVERQVKAFSSRGLRGKFNGCI